MLTLWTCLFAIFPIVDFFEGIHSTLIEIITAESSLELNSAIVEFETALLQNNFPAHFQDMKKNCR